MLNLIYGPSGAGKTDLIERQIARDVQNGTRCYLLVPEQQAYITERDFSEHLPKNAGLFFEIVHFSGLAEALFRKYGGVTRTSINQGTRALLMWDTLRTLSPVLLQYGSAAAADNTLTSLMLQTVSELRANGISAEVLDAVVEKLPPKTPLHKKLSDLSAIEATFRQKIRDCYGEDPEDKIARMATLLKKHDFFRGARVYVDSFTSFTAAEYDVLRAITEQAELLAVSLCTEEIPSRLPHFEAISDTARRLEKIACTVGTEVRKTRLLAKQDEKDPALCILENDLWRFQKKIDSLSPPPEKIDHVTMIKCKNVYEEAEAAALNILALARSGIPFGEIALVVRDVQGYSGILDAALERHSIPYFISERTDFSSKPLFRLILSALRAVCRNYPVQEVITLVKTGLCGVDLQAASLFEEYCETWHISGSVFLQETWSMNPDGLTTTRSARADEILQKANLVRKAVIEPLERLRASLSSSKKVQVKCEALYAYLCELDVQTKLSENAKRDLQSKRLREAGENVRLFRLLCQSLCELCRVLPDAELTNEEFSTAIALLFSSTDLGSIPNVQDCVTIGSASTMRVESIRATLLLGLCEGEFPRAISDDGILCDAEKEALEEFNLIFQSRQKTRFSEELFYIYRAMTKASDHLILSTVMSDVDGSARTPSLAFNRARLLLGFDAEVFDLKKLRAGISCEQVGERLRLPPMPYGTTLRLSQSKIKDFVLCPYRYYSSHCLKLREKKDSTPSYADDGTFLHFIFEKFLSKILNESGSLRIPADGELERMTDEIIEEYLGEVSPFGILGINKRLMHLYTRLRRLALTMLRDMLSELQYSRFIPTYFEQIIGATQVPNGLPPVRIELRNDSCVLMSGVIDRVDLYKANDSVYVKVIDYKSGEHKFALSDVKSGMDIQLILYLHAFLSSNPGRYSAAGAEFLYAKNEKGVTQIQRSGICLEDEEIKEALDASPGAIFSKKLYRQTEEEIEELTRQMLEAIRSTGEEILAGKADKTPSPDACKFCPVVKNCSVAIKNRG